MDAYELMSCAFSREHIGRVRQEASEHAFARGMETIRAEDFVTAVHEGVVNAVEHGGGHGELRLGCVPFDPSASGLRSPAHRIGAAPSAYLLAGGGSRIRRLRHKEHYRGARLDMLVTSSPLDQYRADPGDIRRDRVA
ncbi:hypothetical protein ACFFMN_17680 [Planobispora siamensis]|uniref:hypothetical protein n=1 Tax=Planobispora siamensis TaxID=936338 RepID=UPI0019504C44|nr:hypothetical protein [Planobispora siamensis]